jgi:tRNA U34 5-methylaminomethyl-2-thiouridine-forming methyltransferase MnmC
LERLRLTGDGSHSLYHPAYNQHYHSTSGALEESLHIYIGLGLMTALDTPSEPLRIFEMGFGTGLNALLAWRIADEMGRNIHYTGIEAFPVSRTEAAHLNYEELTSKKGFMQLHECPWAVDHPLSPHFHFRKENITLQEFVSGFLFDVIFFDAFDPKAQPELWTEEIFRKVAAQTRREGVLVTYSSKGIVKRALAAAGFAIKRHKGPGKKLHVLRAIRQ